MMKVDGLPAGRSQPFYHVLVDAAWPKLSTTYGRACPVRSLFQKLSAEDLGHEAACNALAVAQENIAFPRVETKVDNPMIDSIFVGFEDGQSRPQSSPLALQSDPCLMVLSCVAGRYIPSDRLKDIYPDLPGSS